MIQFPHPNAARPTVHPGSEPAPAAAPGDDDSVTTGNPTKAAARNQRVGAATEIDHARLEQIRNLKQRDNEVRQHERAHAAAAAGVPHSPPSYTYTRGPDGRSYATGGEVRIDTAPVAGDPQATLRKARIIQRAALAPIEPSSADRAVAARAAAMAAAARAELQQAAPAEPGEGAKGGATNDTEATAGPRQAADTVAGQCAICGAQHSAADHLGQAYSAGLGSGEASTHIDSRA